MPLHRFTSLVFAFTIGISLLSCTGEPYTVESSKFNFFDLEGAHGYLFRAAAHHNLNQYQQAIENYDEAILLDPHFAWAYYNRGSAYFVSGRYQLAIDDFNQAIT